MLKAEKDGQFLNNQLREVRDVLASAFVLSQDNTIGALQLLKDRYLLNTGGAAAPLVPSLDKEYVYSLLKRLPATGEMKVAVAQLEQHRNDSLLQELLRNKGDCCSLTAKKTYSEVTVFAVNETSGTVERCIVCVDEIMQLNNGIIGEKERIEEDLKSCMENGKHGMLSFCESCCIKFIEPEDENANNATDNVDVFETIQANRRATHLKEPETKRARNK